MALCSLLPQQQQMWPSVDWLACRAEQRGLLATTARVDTALRHQHSNDPFPPGHHCACAELASARPRFRAYRDVQFDVFLFVAVAGDADGDDVDVVLGIHTYIQQLNKGLVLRTCTQAVAQLHLQILSIVRESGRVYSTTETATAVALAILAAIGE